MEQLSTLDRAMRLQQVELFGDLDTETLALLATIARQIEVAAGERLFDQNRPLNSLYVVLSGCIEMRRGETPLFTVGPGETIGNWALFDEQPSVASAAAAENTWLLEICRDDFYDLLADHGEMTRGVLQALFKRVRSLLSTGLNVGGDRARDGF